MDIRKAPENPTVDDLIEFYGGEFASGQTVCIPFRATYEALVSLREQVENLEVALSLATAQLEG